MPELIQVGPIAVNFLRSKHDTNGALDLFEAAVPPKAGMPLPHYHRDWEETCYGLAGVTVLTVDGERKELRAGDVVFIPRGAVHSFVNEAEVPSKMLCLLTPGVLGPEFFREMAVVVGASSPPDRAKMAETLRKHGLIPVMPGEKG